MPASGRRFDSLACGRSSNFSCWLASPILDGCYGDSIAAPATPSYGCSTLGPVIPRVNFEGREWLAELAR
jgi:hypothetical protein